MKRLELFEFEDFDWLPSIIRSGVTNLIIVLHNAMGTSKVISKLILEVNKKSNFNQIIDLGSGSGGPMIDVINEINESDEHKKMNLILTDYYPSPTVIEKINNGDFPNVSYQISSLDATNIANAPKGLKTMVASFHHMKPATAEKILHSAQSNNQPILIYEIAKNTIPTILWWLLLPFSLLVLVLMCLILTLFVRPLTFKQLLFTYLIPIIPIVYAWDGQASIMRTYTFKDVESILDGIKKEGYHWEVNDAIKEDGKKMGYYIMGYPEKMT